MICSYSAASATKGPGQPGRADFVDQSGGAKAGIPTTIRIASTRSPWAQGRVSQARGLPGYSVRRAAHFLEQGKRRIRDNVRSMFLAMVGNPFANVDSVPFAPHARAAQSCFRAHEVTVDPFLVLKEVCRGASGDVGISGPVRGQAERIIKSSIFATGRGSCSADRPELARAGMMLELVGWPSEDKTARACLQLG